MSKVLLVEDNDLNRDMLSRRLERRGYTVAAARDGADAICQALALLPDLILMDISLPEVDGWEATRYLKSQPETRNIPVIALTAHAMPEDRDKSTEAGCDEYETKPVDLERLLAKMETLLTAPAASTPEPHSTGLSAGHENRISQKVNQSGPDGLEDGI